MLYFCSVFQGNYTASLSTLKYLTNRERSADTMKACQTNYNVNQIVRVVRACKDPEMADIIGLIGEVTHPFAFGETKKGWLGFIVTNNKANLNYSIGTKLNLHQDEITPLYLCIKTQYSENVTLDILSNEEEHADDIIIKLNNHPRIVLSRNTMTGQVYYKFSASTGYANVSSKILQLAAEIADNFEQIFIDIFVNQTNSINHEN